jgi:hypothetical protein
MKRLLCLLGCLLCVGSPGHAQDRAPEASALHVVRRGDTLWDLAGRYLNDPFLWPRIFQANRDVVRDPHWIYPLERLRIPGLIPGLVVQPLALVQAGEEERSVFFQTARRTVEVERLRVHTIESAQLPVVRPGDFHRAGLLVPEEAVVPVGVLAEVRSPTIVPLETQRAVQLYDRVFMTLRVAVAVGDRLQLLRPGRVVGTHGRVFASTGLATVEAVHGDVATVVVDVMHASVAPGDLAVHVAAFPVQAGVLPGAGAPVLGRIVTFEAPHALYAVEDIAFLDLGGQSGVREGDEFVVVLPPTRASWGIRPEIEIARLQVVRVTPRTAAARVTEMYHPALEVGLTARRVLAMP